MLYFVQQKRGYNPHLPLIVVESATFRAMIPSLKPISSKLLHKMQLSPSYRAKNAEIVAFFAEFVAHVLGRKPHEGSTVFRRRSFGSKVNARVARSAAWNGDLLTCANQWPELASFCKTAGWRAATTAANGQSS